MYAKMGLKSNCFEDIFPDPNIMIVEGECMPQVERMCYHDQTNTLNLQ